jgi:hypothetical protein
MTGQVLDRRRFLHGVAAIGVLPAIGYGAPQQGGFPSACLTLYDERFAQARMIVSSLAAGGPTRNVDGDPTDVALLLTSARERGRTLDLRGITVESIPFCLAGHAPRGNLRIHRLDRDLFIWEFRNA